MSIVYYVIIGIAVGATVGIMENLILNFMDDFHEKKKIKLLSQYEELEKNLIRKQLQMSYT